MKKGHLKVHMEFEVPIHADMYKSAFDGDIAEITGQDVIAIEIENLQANLDSYYEMLHPHIVSFSFDFDEEE